MHVKRLCLKLTPLSQGVNSSPAVDPATLCIPVMVMGREACLELFAPSLCSQLHQNVPELSQSQANEKVFFLQFFKIGFIG